MQTHENLQLPASYQLAPAPNDLSLVDVLQLCLVGALMAVVEAESRAHAIDLDLVVLCGNTVLCASLADY